MTARITPITTPQESERELLAAAFPDGQAPNLFKTLVRHPALMKRVNALAGAFMAHGLLPEFDREVVVLRVAARTRCEYEIVNHRRIATRIGMAPEAIDRANSLRPELGADDHVGLLLRVTDVLLDHGDITDDDWVRLAARYSEAELLELLMLAGFYAALAGLLRGAGTPLDTAIGA